MLHFDGGAFVNEPLLGGQKVDEERLIELVCFFLSFILCVSSAAPR